MSPGFKLMSALVVALTLQVASGNANVTAASVTTTLPTDGSQQGFSVDLQHDWATWMWATFAALSITGMFGGLLCSARWRRRADQSPPYRYALVEEGEAREGTDEEEARCAKEVSKLPWYEKILRNKSVLLTKGTAGALVRAVDLILDIRTGVAWYMDGDMWWAKFTFLIVAISPVFSFLFVWHKQGIRKALPYLIPGSWLHLKKEAIHLHFIKMLPQSALYREVHKLSAASGMIEILAGIEGFTESFPQACLQGRAYWVKGGDWLNLLSIAFSVLGVAVGIWFAIKAVRRKTVQKRMYYNEKDVETSMSDGCSCDLSGVALEGQTQYAFLWLARHDGDLQKWVFRDDGGSHAAVDDAFIEQFALSCSQLSSVDFRGCKKITDHGVEQLAVHCSQLTSVDFSGCDNIIDHGVEKLAVRCSQLTFVDFSFCDKITDHGVEKLAVHCSQLTSVDFGLCGNITDHGVEKLAVRCSQPTFVDFGGCGYITDHGVEQLAVRCSQLTSVDFGGCDNITDHGVEQLAVHCSQLKSVDFNRCDNIIDHGVEQLAVHCSQLTSVGFRFCGKITDHGVEELAVHCSQLTSVDFNGCGKITDHGVEQLAVRCSQLTSVGFRGCGKITDHGVEQLAVHCSQLTSVVFSGCDNITDHGVEQLAVRCSQLTSVNFYFCDNITGHLKNMSAQELKKQFMKGSVCG